MRKKKYSWQSVIVTAMIILCGCGQIAPEQQEVGNEDAEKKVEQQIEEQEKEDTEVLIESTPAAENLEKEEAASKSEYDHEEKSQIEQPFRFVDAWGEWFETTINPNVKKHDYNWECLKRDGDEVSYQGDTRYSIKKGVDVSHHQGTIDWKKVKAAGYDFAFVRMAYRGYGKTGSLNLDRAYYNNIVNAQKAGLDVGVYVFSQAINEEEALEEAQLVIENLEGLELQLPVVFDPELIRDDDARTDQITGEQFTKNTIAFCEKVKEAGYEPMIYSNMYWEAFLFDLEQLAEYPIWYADYENIPQTPYHFDFWQYSESGYVDGIEGKTDLDVWFVTEE